MPQVSKIRILVLDCHAFVNLGKPLSKTFNDSKGVPEAKNLSCGDTAHIKEGNWGHHADTKPDDGSVLAHLVDDENKNYPRDPVYRPRVVATKPPNKSASKAGSLAVEKTAIKVAIMARKASVASSGKSSVSGKWLHCTPPRQMHT